MNLCDAVILIRKNNKIDVTSSDTFCGNTITTDDALYDLVKAVLFSRLDERLDQPTPKPRKKWLPHDGGACPVAPETMVKVKGRDGSKSSAWMVADQFVWPKVTHYRVKKEPKP